MNGNYYAVIMAGGGGTRLWPLSRQDKPKQTLKLIGERTLFQIAVDRLLGLFPADHIMVVTSQGLADMFHQDVPDIPEDNYIIEPSGRDTAAAIGLSAITIKQRDPDAIMAVLTADHFIEREGRFLHVLRAAEQVAEEDFLVTLGIHPTFPSTGFGYIQQGSLLGEYENFVVFRAETFKEKPNLETAKAFIEAEDHSWNSGMFIWKVSRVLGEIERQMPPLHQVLSKIEAAWGTSSQQAVLEKEWNSLEKISIDFGIMEGAENVAVIPARGLGWSDVGSWNAVYDVLPKSSEGNVNNCPENMLVDSKDTLIFANDDCGRLVVAMGVEDLIIVDTSDVLLVCDKDHAQNVRSIVDKLKELSKTNYL